MAAEASAAPEAPTPDARAWVLVDASDGERLAGRGDTNQLSIASTTKLMTAYVALRELPLNRKIAAPDYQPISPAETLAGLAPGERMSVSDLLYALLLASANDAAVTLAEGASGSVPAFVREMNRTAAALGLTGTHYENPIGLDSAGNYSTASDLATLTRRLRRERIFREIVDTEHALLKTGDHTREITNRNTLLVRGAVGQRGEDGPHARRRLRPRRLRDPQGRHAGVGGARRPGRGRSRRRDARAARVRVLALPARRRLRAAESGSRRPSSTIRTRRCRSSPTRGCASRCDAARSST